MAALPPFIDHCIELFAPLGAVRVRRMFGGWGLYLDDLFVAVIASDRLYLKVDAASRERFVAAGCEPFTFDTEGGAVSLSYLSAPDEALDSPAMMASWARLALQAALTAQMARARKPGRRVKQPPHAARSAATRPTSPKPPKARQP